jgi:hypothetical protein
VPVTEHDQSAGIAPQYPLKTVPKRGAWSKRRQSGPAALGWAGIRWGPVGWAAIG